MTDVILNVDGVSVSFGGLRAVNNVSLQARDRQITSVIGPNGAGKSTLFNLIVGAIRSHAGHVRFQDQDITGWPSNRICRAGMARSFQITKLFFDLTVEENLRLASQFLEADSRLLQPLARSTRAEAKARELLERFLLTKRRNDLAGYLSHGEQRRLEIALALASEPRMLLLDEPTQGMSHGDTEDTKSMIRDIAEDIAVMLVEHDIELVMDLSHWIVVMHQGQKLAEGVPQEVRANPAVREAYLGEA